MCRLFGMTTCGPRVRATFWLLEAPDSLKAQSLRTPDGTGLGWFSLGEEPVRDRAPIAAFRDADFNAEARYTVSHTFVSHVRYASTGAVDVRNSHPFVMSGRLFAHNGLVRGLDELTTWSGDAELARVEGATDSELVFAYLTTQIRQHGDTTAGLIAAVRRIAAELPVFALNLLLAESRRLWALRYPDTHELWVLNPAMDAPEDSLKMRSGREHGHMRMQRHREPTPTHVVASERMDDDPTWRLLAPGELLVVDGAEATSLFPFDPPAHQMTIADLSATEAVSQT
ncbi:class II glutamine amidotransferase [Actinomadura nitritigenes]|uniref:class II glutamine amidotransferase n=1 Tax=Actinomadura nitritigenes TaxID=134602 RepID=UPI003D8FE563